MRKPASRKVSRGMPVASSATRPAPVGGWNARDSLAAMPASDAVSLVNFFPATTECKLRYGSSSWATGLSGQVETLMDYEGGTTQKMFGIGGGNVYDCTASGAVGAAVLSGLSNSRWQWANVATAGGNFLYMANGVDAPYTYDGATWANPAITGVTTTKLNCPIIFKTRVIFTETGTLKTWYLGTNAIAGAANSIDMSAVAQLGGYIVSHATWTIDAGTGVDDYYVAVTNNGEIIVYQGTDPSDATKWALKGVWRVGAPVGTRCFIKYAGDLLMVCQDGVMPLSGGLQSSRVNPRVFLTDKIQWAMSEAVTTYGSNFGWEIFYYPGENQLWVNVPVGTGSQQQYVMNSITKNWCSYTGWSANTFLLFRNTPYFGGNGAVYKAWDTNADSGAAITAIGLQAFSDFGLPGKLKRFVAMRPILRTNGTPAVLGSINVDFNTDASTAPLSFASTSSASWDSSTWDTGLWGGDLNIYQSLQGVTGVGYYGAPQLKTSSSGVDLRWVSTDVVLEPGAII